MNENSNRAEAESLIGMAEKLLQNRDLNGTKDFAILAQEMEPFLDGPDQILAVVDVLLSSEKRVNNQHDWYSILQLGRGADDPNLIKKQYRRLALLLHPDKNKYPFADQAFKLVADAWAVLSDFGKKSLYDKELSLFERVDLPNAVKLPVRRSQRPRAKKQGGDNAKSNANTSNSNDDNNRSKDAKEKFHHEDQTRKRTKLSSFWTACPYCYILYEYPTVYEDCCLRCNNCQRAFHAALIPSLPPLVPGKEAYYCCWGFFPLGFVLNSGGGGEKSARVGRGEEAGFPNWMPPIFASQQPASSKNCGMSAEAPMGTKSDGNVATNRAGVVQASAGRGRVAGLVPRKRGRPRKYPVQA